SRRRAWTSSARRRSSRGTSSLSVAHARLRRPQPFEIELVERVVGLERERALERGDRGGAIAAQEFDVGAVLLHERELRRDALGLVELARRGIVVAAARGLARALGDLRRERLRRRRRLAGVGRARQPLQRRGGGLVAGPVAQRAAIGGDGGIALAAPL